MLLILCFAEIFDNDLLIKQVLLLAEDRAIDDAALVSS